jgi:thiosulfate reductase cytochrome b subunit
MHNHIAPPKYIKYLVAIAGVILLVIGLALTNISAVAQTSPFHPPFSFLDEKGKNVLDSQGPVSTMHTCGACHDTEFISTHSFHADIGLENFTTPGNTTSGREWDTSLGYFGKWNPITYGYLTPTGDTILDLSTAAWIQTFGARHVGGGPAVYSREGVALVELLPDANNPETNILDSDTGQVVVWDWKESGIVEMNCFLCHFPTPDNQARIESLQAGLFAWANTATLNGSGIVNKVEGKWQWNVEAFDENGELLPEYISIQDPANGNCGLCHGIVQTDPDTPVAVSSCEIDDWQTAISGQVVSAQRLSDSGINLKGKETLTHSFDIHAERLVSCTDCHYSLNNPIYYQTDNPEVAHLQFDPRRLELGEYLYQPLHQFARGESAQGTVAPETIASMRECDTCHDSYGPHTWLPYTEQHMNALACQTCHIPSVHTPAYQNLDWTVVTIEGQATSECRGVEGETGTAADLITGYEPVILPYHSVDDEMMLAPYNLVTAWFWVYDDPARPVRQQDLEMAWLEGDNYHPDILSLFDQDRDQVLQESELVIDSNAKEELIASHLQALGLQNPRIVGEIQPYSIDHNVVDGEWAIRDCEICHSESSRITQPIMLSDRVPGGVVPEFIQGTNLLPNGEVFSTEDGKLYYRPHPQAEGFYIFGHDNVRWVDWFGTILFLGVLGGIVSHGGLRVYAAKRNPLPEQHLKKVYMYTFYERIWHWLQTLVILILTFTGLIIHKPEMFGIFNFKGVVWIHNIMAAILVANAALALFYNLVSGDIKRFIPEPKGFFNQMFSQALYYLRGIFKGEPHPFERTPEKRLNPLQKVTYFGILNVLLPLQVITGALMWGVQQWPQVAFRLGGLPLLAPFHTLIAWTFSAFIVGHVYLTTTGHTPLASIKSMIVGWDDIEELSPADEEKEK